MVREDVDLEPLSDLFQIDDGHPAENDFPRSNRVWSLDSLGDV